MPQTLPLKTLQTSTGWHMLTLKVQVLLWRTWQKTRHMYVSNGSYEDVSKGNIQKEPVESLLRSLLLVLMDNATAEYSFITSFFATEPQPLPSHLKESSNPLSPPTSLSPLPGESDDNPSKDGSEQSTLSRRRMSGIISSTSLNMSSVSPKEEQANLNTIWKQVMDPVLEYTKVRSFRFSV